MVRGVEHVALAAQDPQGLADWYCRVLGLRVLFQNDREPPTFLVGGEMGAVLEIMPANGEKPLPHDPFDPGIRHLALAVADLDEACERVRAQVYGLMPAVPAAGGGRIAYFSDPEGNLLQFVERPVPLLG